MTLRRSRPARLLTALAGLAALATVVTLAACTTNPTTGKSQYNALSREEEIALGEQNMPAMIQEYGGESTDAQLKAYVAEVGQKMAAVTEGDYPSLPWQFTLLDSEVINAFAMPGGKVFMSMGLAVEMTNEAQLAGVLGHEIGHVTARHINDQIARQTGMQLGVGLAGVLLGGESAAVQQAAGYALNVGGQTVLLKYGRDQESESDHLGMRYMSKVGYDPRGQLQVMQILDRVAGEGGGSEFFSTHPLPKTRITRIEELLKGEFASTQNNPAYQLKEAEFKQRFLSRVTVKKQTALPHHNRLALTPASGSSSGKVVKWDQPLTWCGVCQQEEAAHNASKKIAAK